MEQIALNWGAEPNLYTVSDLTQAMRQALNERFTDIWVSGEISGTRVPASGHYYFTLKDESAQLKCVCYRMTARYLKFKPQDGIAALVRGRVDLYEARGEVQMIVEAIEPQGHGALQLAFEQLKKKLAMEGLFEASRKRALPAFPSKIGIVTSPTGSVIRDILQILERRFAGRHVLIYPAQVQGEGSIEQVSAGIDYFSRSGWADVVIVARGGGSLEDLWTFNEETVARAIAASSVPVISAVGHETDFTIADFVADLRAPTPSAAAELVIGTRESVEERFDGCEIKLRQAIRLNFALKARKFHALAVDRTRLHRAIGKQMQKVDEMDYRLRDRSRSVLDEGRRTLEMVTSRLGMSDVRLKLASGRRRLGNCEASIQQAMRLQMSRAQGRLAPMEGHLRQLSPLNILERGYAIVESGGRVVRSPGEVEAASDLSIRVRGGSIGAGVRSRSFHYYSGEEVRPGDRVRHAGNPEVVQFVSMKGDAESEWFAQQGAGVMIGDVFFPTVADEEDIELVSRRPADE